MDIVIIPSATIISSEMQVFLGSIPNVMLPLNQKPILHKLYNQYKRFDKIFILVKESKEIIEQYLEIKDFDKIELIEIAKLKDLGHTIKSGISKILNKYRNIDRTVINFGDTFVENFELIKKKDVISYNKTANKIRWTNFKYKGGTFLEIVDKYKETNLDEEYCAFVGLFSLSDIKLFYKIISKTTEIKNSKIDSFYSALLNYNSKKEFEFSETEKWIDLGHPDKYIASKHEVKERYFNSITIDRNRGILTKRSENKIKFHNEILWYLKLPNDVKYVTPRILEYSDEYEDMFIKMEYYGYNTLNEIFVYGDLSIGEWKQIFNSLLQVFEDMNKYTLALPQKRAKNNIYEMYIKKTKSRLSLIKETKQFASFFTKPITVNNKAYKPLDVIINEMERVLIENKIFDIKNFSIIHGDLCFSNILYDTNSKLVRYIDPRGEFGDLDIYGDIRYDIAKLSHSINGLYDFIINDLFYVDVKNNTINYKIIHREKHLKINELFTSYLQKLNINIDQIQILEAILFLSMIPLHKDTPNRQYVMLATGLQLISKYL